MKIRTILLLLLSLSVSTSAIGQMKIGYVNIELVLAYLPETQAMNRQLQTFQQKLGEKLQAKQVYAQTKLQEYQGLLQSNPNPDEATKQALEAELMKLDEEIKKDAAEADQKLMERRQNLMDPILQNIDKNLKALAAEEGYDYILNSIDGQGVSIVLHGPEQHDLTEKLMTRLGVDIPSKD